MPDLRFVHPLLASVCHATEPDRHDLESYVQLVRKFRARTVLDVGCGTGTSACMLAKLGVHALGVHPAKASLDVARTKVGAETVRRIHGDLATLPSLQVDVVTMTGNVAQVFITDEEWIYALARIRGALRPTGHFIFEARNPDKKAWLEWNKDESFRRIVTDAAGPLDKWDELLDLCDDLVSFRTTFVFERDGVVLTSDSILRFRQRIEIEDSLSAAGMTIDEIREAPDRPGLGFVFIARRAG